MPGFERSAVFAGIVNVETDIVAEPVNVVLAKRFAVQIFAVRVDVIVGNFMQALVAFGTESRRRA